MKWFWEARTRSKLQRPTNLLFPEMKLKSAASRLLSRSAVSYVKDLEMGQETINSCTFFVGKTRARRRTKFLSKKKFLHWYHGRGRISDKPRARAEQSVVICFIRGCNFRSAFQSTVMNDWWIFLTVFYDWSDFGQWQSPNHGLDTAGEPLIRSVQEHCRSYSKNRSRPYSALWSAWRNRRRWQT